MSEPAEERSAASGRGQGLVPQGRFLALTLVVMVVILFLAKNLVTAMLTIGLIANFLIISSQLSLVEERHFSRVKPPDRPGSDLISNPSPWLATSVAGGFGGPTGEAGGPTGRREPFLSSATTAPPGGAPPSFPAVPATDLPLKYPGAIEFDELETSPALGWTDRTDVSNDTMPRGNPFQTSRVAAPEAAPPCVDDDALAGLMDLDELNTYQVRSRNVPERVWAGALRRKAHVGRYVSEELDEAEDAMWWGRDEL